MHKDNIDVGQLLEHLSSDEQKVVSLIARQKPLEEITRRVGLSESMIASLIHKARFAFGANDDLAGEYLYLIEQWSVTCGAETLLESEPLQVKVNSADGAVPPEVVEELEGKLSPHEMRDVAVSLLRLSDAIDQRWHPSRVRSVYSWPAAAAKIEKQSFTLGQKAKLLIEREQIYEQFLPSEILNRPLWNMLLDLFVQFSGGAKVSVKSLSIAGRCPQSTALRHINHLEEIGLISRENSLVDHRVVLCSLTKAGVVSVGKILERVAV